MLAARKICDPHVHLYRSATAAKVKRALYGQPGLGIPSSYLEDLPENFKALDYLAHAEPQGVALAINLPVATRDKTAADVAKMNVWCAEQQESSENRVRSVGAISPHLNQQDLRTELNRIIELDLLPAIKLVPMTSEIFQEFDPADKKFNFFYRVLAERNMMIVWHVGSVFKDNNVATPAKIAAIQREYGLKMIAAHFAGNNLEETERHLSGLEKVTFDLAYKYPMPDPYPHIEQLSGAQLRWAIKTFGLNRIFSGFDFPYKSIPVGLTAFDRLAKEADLSAEEQRAVLWQSPVDFYGLAA